MTLCPRCGSNIDWFGDSSRARCSVCKNLLYGMNVSDEHEQRMFDKRYNEVLMDFTSDQKAAYFEGRNYRELSKQTIPNFDLPVNPYDLTDPRHRYWNAGYHKAKFNYMNI